MEMDEFPRRPDDPLALLVAQELGELSIEELEHRLAILRDEITRSQAMITAKQASQAVAETFFKT
jgi:uncharacterized small protein (DUF1192 family)